MTGNTRDALRSVAIVGGGPVALIAAVAFAQALPGAAISVTPAPVAPDALADRLPLALPATHHLLATLGLNPDRLLAKGVARPRLATRFDDWSRDGGAWLVGDDSAATLPEGRLSALWLRAAPGRRFDELIPACVAASAGIADPRVEPALHLDPARLTAALTAIAGQAGIAHTAPFAAFAAGSLGLQDGRRIAADLFVDAAGPARLLGGDAPFDDWREALPATRLILSPSTADPGPLDRYRATPTGWTAHWPGATGTAGTAGTAGADGDGIAIAPGRLAAPFADDVLAIGDAATQPGPLGLTGFTLALIQLALILELMPARAPEPLLRSEYNRRAGERADRLRDFLGAHYHAGGRSDGPFWRHVAAARRPATLDRLLAQFARRGQVVAADGETVPRDAWFALLLGQGIRPQRPDPIALSVDRAAATRAIETLATRLASLELPS